MKNNKVIVDLFFKRGKYLLYLINERVKSGERREDVISSIFALCPSLEAEKIAINTIGLKPENVIRYANIFDGKKDSDLKGYTKWLKEMIEIDKLGLNNVIRDGCELFCIQNPPYSGNLHLSFLESGLDLISKYKGKMVIIEPSTWIIDVRRNTTAEIYDAIKERINGHVKSVVIENYNREFNVTLSMPFSITTIDMSQTFSTIEFICCGEKRDNINNIYDCNLIGQYEVINNIFNKVKNFGDMMKQHITNKDEGSEYWYAKCVGINKDSNISGSGASLCGAVTDRVGMTYDSEKIWSETSNGNYLIPYTSIGYHYYKNEISNKPLQSYDRGKKLTDKIAWNIFGTKCEIENWKYFVFNNKLPLFLNICLTHNRHNNSVNFLPWLVDKQYTDDEINKLFCFTNEEIKLIDSTIKKYERNSPWFKRYMCGKNGATDEEVTEYIKKITEEC